MFLEISKKFTNNKKIVELVNNIFCLISGKDPKLEKKTPSPISTQSPITPIIKPNSDVNDLFSSKPVVNQSSNSSPSLFDFGNSNSSSQNAAINNINNNSNTATNQEKKSFGFLKKKNTAEETNNLNSNKAVINKNNNINNNGPDLFSLICEANQSPTQKPVAGNTEKSGFSFIKSSAKNKEQTNGSSDVNTLNAVNFSNNAAAAVASKNTNYDLLNEIYAQSIGEIPNNNINADNKNVNLLRENLNNLNFNNQNNFGPNNNFSNNNSNNNNINSNSFGGLNFNVNNGNYNNNLNQKMNGNFNNGMFNNNDNNNSNNNYHINEANNNINNGSFEGYGYRKSSYVAPNFDVMFGNSPDMNNPHDRKLREENLQHAQNSNTKTNDEIDFLTELNLAKKK